MRMRDTPHDCKMAAPRDVIVESSSSEDEEALLWLLLVRRRRRRLKARCRKNWTRPWVMRRQAQGVFSNLIQELNAEDPEKFRQYHRLDRQSFQKVLALVAPLITKQETHMRCSISPSERLAVTLRYLATGRSMIRSQPMNDSHDDPD